MSQAEMIESFTNIEPENNVYDIPDARKKVEDFLGCPPPRKTCGFQILVALYTTGGKLKNADGSASLIEAPDTISSQDRFRSCTGMVVQMGPMAYKGTKFADTGAWCKVGDWVVIGRHDGMQLDYRGRPVMLINDDKIGMVIDNPSYAKRGSY